MILKFTKWDDYISKMSDTFKVSDIRVEIVIMDVIPGSEAECRNLKLVGTHPLFPSWGGDIHP